MDKIALIKKMIEAADTLDQVGLSKQAVTIDKIMQKLAQHGGSFGAAQRAYDNMLPPEQSEPFEVPVSQDEIVDANNNPIGKIKSAEMDGDGDRGVLHVTITKYPLDQLNAAGDPEDGPLDDNALVDLIRYGFSDYIKANIGFASLPGGWYIKDEHFKVVSNSSDEVVLQLDVENDPS